MCILSGCAHSGTKDGVQPKAQGLSEAKVDGPIELKLKALPGRTEKVAYLHKSFSKSYEGSEIRHQKEESLEFTTQAETLKSQPDQFTQVLSILRKDGTANLHDFAMPEEGEKLEITATSKGKILKSGEYPNNSIFYVPPISLPDGPVNVGDTWTMQASWLSLEEMIPFQIDMVSILKNVWNCGNDRCAEIEVSAQVDLQGPMAQAMAFKSVWQGKMYFALNAGTVVWSRTDSEESVMTANVRRQINSCLESVMVEPADVKLPGLDKPACEPLPPAKDTVTLAPTATSASL